MKTVTEMGNCVHSSFMKQIERGCSSYEPRNAFNTDQDKDPVA